MSAVSVRPTVPVIRGLTRVALRTVQGFSYAELRAVGWNISRVWRNYDVWWYLKPLAVYQMICPAKDGGTEPLKQWRAMTADRIR